MRTVVALQTLSGLYTSWIVSITSCNTNHVMNHVMNQSSRIRAVEMYTYVSRPLKDGGVKSYRKHTDFFVPTNSNNVPVDVYAHESNCCIYTMSCTFVLTYLFWLTETN